MNAGGVANAGPSDPAAVLGVAVSLWAACQQPQGCRGQLDLSVAYGGGDQWMREVMRVATLFEAWATRHVCFDELDECWPYLLEDRFGDACVKVVGAGGLAEFDERDCLRVALRLRLPVIGAEAIAVPLDLGADNPIAGAGFTRFRIRTMLRRRARDDVTPMSVADDPCDEAFERPFIALYGIGADGLLEHIADRQTYAEARELALKLAPGIAFPQMAVAQYAATN